MVNHKHKGVLTSTGALRSHPISRRHGDLTVLKYHNEEIAFKSRTTNKKLDNILRKKENKKLPKVKILRKGKTKKEINNDYGNNVDCGCELNVDSDGYLFVDLQQQTKVKGLRVKFTRVEGRKKRTVGLQIEK